MIDPDLIRARFASLSPYLDERGRRLFAATEARVAGYGGIVAVSRATGIAASTIGRGLKELAAAAQVNTNRLRRPGGGRKSLVTTDPALLGDLLALVEPSERGDPMSPLRWTCKSLRGLAAELAARGHRISHTVVGELLKRATTTETGLTVRCELDTNSYPKGIAVSEQEMAAITMIRADFHGEWNYTIQPLNHPERAVDS